MITPELTTQPGAMWSLPLFINRRNKLLMGIILAVITAFLYFTSNHIHIFEPKLLPMTALDQAIPFIPHTVWIYISEYLLFFGVYFSCQNIENTNRYVYAFMFQQVISAFIFWMWPTTYPRELFPLPKDLDSITYYVFSSLRESDTPANCCPSLHVSSVYLSSLMFLKEQRGKFPYFFLWASAIAVTTLTTKQHYIIDVVAGFLSAVFVYWIFAERVSYRDANGLQANR